MWNADHNNIKSLNAHSSYIYIIAQVFSEQIAVSKLSLDLKESSSVASLNNRQYLHNTVIAWINLKYPLNLSILISEGKENNNNFPSNGEWKGTSFPPKVAFARMPTNLEYIARRAVALNS